MHSQKRMSLVKETVKSTLQILKSRVLPIGHISNRANGAVWKKVNLTGNKRWILIDAPVIKNPLDLNKQESEKFLTKDSNNQNQKLLNSSEDQPFLFTKESFSKNSKLESSYHSKTPQPITFKKPVFIPQNLKTLEELRTEIRDTLELSGQELRAKDFFESSQSIDSLNKLLNYSYKFVSIDSNTSNNITRSIVSNTIKEAKQSRSEAMRGNQNAVGEHDVQSNQITEINSNSLVKVVKEFEGLPLSVKDSEYLDQIRDSLSKNLIAPKIASQISDTLSKIPVKESSIVLKVLRNYISNSLLTYNAKIEPKKFDDSNPLKRTVLATKFRNLAEDMNSQIQHMEKPPISMQRPTRRRSGIASSMMEKAKKLRDIQAILKGMSREIEEAILPESLKTIKSKSDVEALLSLVKYFKKYNENRNKDSRILPLPQKIEVRINKFNDRSFFSADEDIRLSSSGGIYGHNIHWANKIGLLTKEEYKEALKFHADPTKYDNFINLTDLNEIEKLNKLKNKVYKISNHLCVKPANPKSDKVIEINGKQYELYLKNKQINEYRDDNSLRLLKLGFETTQDVEEAGSHLFKLIQEYSNGAPTEQEIKIKKLERNLIGSKISGFFPTPKNLGKTMIDEADIQPGMDVLEPSAGKGDLSDLIRNKKVEPDTIEIDYSLREILKEKDHKIVGSNFLDYNEKKYDRIIMNPPFERGQDIDHVQHAYDLLKPGGKLVSIMAEGPFFRSDNKSKNFRNWLDEVGGDSRQLPNNSFMGSESFRQTGVSTRLVTITKD
ncbi:SAM-dependent methyltransferase [Leptospira interrogans serovar Ricardi]|nr:SAM-dependent methyltransferase [Leptospira interrogans serovar Ricardi]